MPNFEEKSAAEESSVKPKDGEKAESAHLPKAVRQPGIIFSALGAKISSEELLGRINGESKDS